jgi:hypothetical protein
MTYNVSNNTNGIGTITAVVADSFYAGDTAAALSADKKNQLAGIVLDSKVFIKNPDTEEIAKIENYDVNTSSVVVLRDTVSKVDIDTSGSGYLIPPKVVIAPSITGETATALCALGIGGKIDIVEVTSIGGGYKTVPPVVTLDEGPTEHAIVQPIVNSIGVITQLNIIDRGKGYCKKPILSILNPNSTDEFNAKLFLPPFGLNQNDGSITNWDEGDSQIEYEYDVTAKFFGKKVSVTIDKPFPMVYSLSNPVSLQFNYDSIVDAEAPYSIHFYKVNDNYYCNFVYPDYYIQFDGSRWNVMQSNLCRFFAEEGGESPLQSVEWNWYYGLDNDVYWNQTSNPDDYGYPYTPYEGVPAPVSFTTVAIPKTSFNNSNIRVISLTDGGSVADSNVPFTIVTAYVKEGYTLTSPGTFGFNIIDPGETIYEDIGREDLLNMFSVGSFLYTSSKTFPIIERGEISSNELRLRIRSRDVTTLANGVNILSDDDETTSDDSEDITSGFLSGKIEDNYFDLFYNKKQPIVYLTPDKSNQSSLSARIVDEEWVQTLKTFSLVYQGETAKKKVENYKPVDIGTISYKSPYSGLFTAKDIDPLVGGIPVFIKPMVEGYDVYNAWMFETGKYGTLQKALTYPKEIEYFDTWNISIQHTNSCRVSNGPYFTDGKLTTNLNMKMRWNYIPDGNGNPRELFIEGDDQWRNYGSSSFPTPLLKPYYSKDITYRQEDSDPYETHDIETGSFIVMTGGGKGSVNSQLGNWSYYSIQNIVNQLNNNGEGSIPGMSIVNALAFNVTGTYQGQTPNGFLVSWTNSGGTPETYYSTGGTGYTQNINSAKIYYSVLDSYGRETLEIVIPTINQTTYLDDNYSRSLSVKISIGPELGTLKSSRLLTDTIGIVSSKGDLSSNTGVFLDGGGNISGSTDGRYIFSNGSDAKKTFLDLLSYYGTRTFVSLNIDGSYYYPVKVLKYDVSDSSSYFSIPISGKPTTEYSILFSLKTYTYVNGIIGTQEVSSEDIQIEFKTDSAGLAVGSSVVDPPLPGFIRKAVFVKIVSERPIGLTTSTTYENTFLIWLQETRPNLYLDAIRYSTRDNTINFALLNDYLSTRLVFSTDKANSKAGQSVVYYKDKNGNNINQALITTAPDIDRDIIRYKTMAGILF